MPKTPVAPASQCPMDYAFQRVGGKHKGRLLWNLQFKPLRYGELRRLVSGVSTKMLTQALRELEADGLIARHEFAEVPPRVEYTLLPTGAQLLPFINLLRGWAEQQMQAAGVPVLHTKAEIESAALCQQPAQR